MPNKMPQSGGSYLGRNDLDYGEGMYQHGADEMPQHGYQQERERYQQQVGRNQLEEEHQNERMSPASSTSSTQDLSPYNASKLKKRSSSTSSGLRTLGRIFGTKKNKQRDQFNRNADSDSELSFNQEAQPNKLANGVNNWTPTANPVDFDRRKNKKKELLEEVTFL
jgi:hypothetical protein